MSTVPLSWEALLSDNAQEKQTGTGWEPKASGGEGTTSEILTNWPVGVTVPDDSAKSGRPPCSFN